MSEPISTGGSAAAVKIYGLAFNYMNRNESASLIDVFRDVRRAAKGEL